MSTKTGKRGKGGKFKKNKKTNCLSNEDVEFLVERYLFISQTECLEILFISLNCITLPLVSWLKMHLFFLTAGGSSRMALLILDSLIK